MAKQINHRHLSKIKDFVVQCCRAQTSNEVCGFIGWDAQEKKYIATLEKNQSHDPAHFFMLNPAAFLKFKNSYELIGIYHSHIVGDEQPSEFDMKMSGACAVPFIVYSLNTKKFHIYVPQTIECDVKLLERLKEKLK